MKQHTVMTPYMVGEVHYYSTEINGELVLFDTGPPTPAGLAELEATVDLTRLKHLFITHCHVDHYGLAAHIEANSAAQIYFPRSDAQRMRHQEEWLAGLQGLLVRAGFQPEFGRRLQQIFQAHQTLPPCPKNFQIVEDSEVPEQLGLRYLACPGHSQSDLVHLCNGFAVTGDILLREIFQSPLLDPEVGSFTERFKNYHAYCASLLKLSTLRGLVILPAHRNFVEGVDETVIFYLKKLLERAGRVKRFAGVEQVSDVVTRIFGPSLVDPFVIYLKASEIYFMRDFLADPARLRVSLEQIDLFDRVREDYLAAVEGLDQA
jgi:hydroxyacylglutathione hydrolase